MSSSIQDNKSRDGFMDIPIRLGRMREYATADQRHEMNREIDRVLAAWEWATEQLQRAEG